MHELEFNDLSALRALPASLALLNRDGTVVSVSQDWVQGTQDSPALPPLSVGLSYPEVCGAHGTPAAAEVAAGLRAVLSGQQEEFTHLYLGRAPGPPRWFRLRVWACATPQDFFGAVMHEEIMAPEQPQAAQLSQETQMVLQSIADAYVTLDPAWRVTTVSPQAQRLLEQLSLAPDVVGQSFWDLFSELIDHDLEIQLRAAAHTQQASASETWVPLLGRWAEVRCWPSPAGMVLFLADIHERKLTEAALKSQESRLRMALEGIKEGVAMVDLELRFTYVNPQLAATLGYQPDEMVGQLVRTFIAEGQAVEVATQAQARRDGIDGNYELHWVHRHGPLVWLRVSGAPLRSSDGQVTGSLGVFSDITAQKQLQDERISILESISDAFFALDAQGNFTYVNEQAAQFLQFPAEALLGKNMWAVFPAAKDTDIGRHYQVAMTQRQPVTFEAYFPVLGRWLGVRTYPFRGGLSVYFRDISKRKADEQQAEDNNAILESIVRQAPLSEILADICLLVEHQLPDYLCSVMLYEQGRLTIGAAPSLSEALKVTLEGVVVGAQGQGGETVSEDYTAQMSADPTHHGDTNYGDAGGTLSTVLVSLGIRASAALPIYDEQGRTLGVALLYSPHPGEFPAFSLELLQRARRLSAIAIEQRRLAQQLVQQAQTDVLTRLPNRTLFAARLEQAIGAAAQTGTQLALLYLDIDDFKPVNDSLGHPAGDEVLRKVAARLSSCLRKSDVLARLGGDEFAVLMPYGQESDARHLAERIGASFQAPFAVDDHEVYLQASLGISTFPASGQDAETLQRHADIAMYHAKRHNTHFEVFEHDMNALSLERFRLSTALRRALENEELSLHYQPQVRLSDGAVLGVEALLRWHHPELGSVSPDVFIPLAEQNGLILEIGTWVLCEACRQAVEWQQRGLPPMRMAVNVSALQFERPDFVEQVERCLKDSGLSAQVLELELTERVVMGESRDVLSQMKRLRQLGVSLSLDDFGTGYSSLSYLTRLPLDVLKIDRTFVADLTPHSIHYAVLKAVAGLAIDLNLTTVAEGIETQAEQQVIEGLGVSCAQGYLFSRPLPAQDVPTFLQQHRKRGERPLSGPSKEHR